MEGERWIQNPDNRGSDPFIRIPGGEQEEIFNDGSVEGNGETIPVPDEVQERQNTDFSTTIDNAMAGTLEQIEGMSLESGENKKGMVALAKEMGGQLQNALVENSYLGPIITHELFIPAAVCLITGALCAILRGEYNDLSLQADSMYSAMGGNILPQYNEGVFDWIQHPNYGYADDTKLQEILLHLCGRLTGPEGHFANKYPPVFDLYQRGQIIDKASIALGITSILAGGGTIWKAMKNRTKKTSAEKE